MLTYSFKNTGSESLYEQLYSGIRNDILSGNLTPGTKLPSKRTFAKNLGISTITVENAYALLISEGYIYSIPKKGYFVADTEAIAPKPIMAAVEKKPEYFADFTSSSTLHTLFPFTTWAKLMRGVLSERQPELMRPSPGCGITLLREAIAEHLYQFCGMRVLPSQVVIGSGTEYLYGLIIQLLGQDKVFAVEEPGYSRIAKVYAANGVKYRYIPLDADGVEIHNLKESGADILHISPSHHFPTGTVTPMSRRYELLSWAADHESRYIIEDDYDSEFRLGGRPLPSLRSIDVCDKVVYMNTFTKSLASTIRISYMVLPLTLAELFYKKLGFYSCTVSNFEQYTLAEFINGGYFGNHINRMRRYYLEERDIFLNELAGNKYLCNANIFGKDSGLHFLLEIDAEISDAELIKRARMQGINISCLSGYYSDTDNVPQHIIVLNYSGIEKDKICEAVKRLGEAVGQ